MLRSNRFRTRFCILLIIITIFYVADYFLYRCLYFSEETRENVYDVYTSECKILHMNPFSDSVIKYTEHLQRFSPCIDKNKSNIEFVLSNDTHLYLNEIISKIRGYKRLNCSYQITWRKEPASYDRGEKVEFSRMIYINKPVKIEDEFLKVFCYLKRKMVYQNYHNFVPVIKKDRHIGFHLPEDKMNPILIVLKSVSRHNLYRQMPKTVEYLLNGLEAIEYLGHHSIGDTSIENMMAILTGYNLRQLKTCNCPSKRFRYNRCPFIWNAFHDQYYSTVFAEESARRGLFTYEQNGFMKLPTTHFYSPSAFSDYSFESEEQATFCIGTRPTITSLLEYALKFLRGYHQAKVDFFATFFESSVTNYDQNYPEEFDGNFQQFLKDVNATGVLENNILFFMSDQGYRVNRTSQTYQDSFESRLPFLYIVPPKWFKEKYPWAFKNLKENANKLTSHFDLYDTLEAILEQKYSNDNSHLRNGISLFQPIPEGRTCVDAMIPLLYCTCNLMIPTSQSDLVATNVVNFLITEMNKIVSVNRNCAQLFLYKILDARHASNKTKVVGRNVYTVVFQTAPGGGIFESTVSCKTCSNDFKISKEVTRKNAVGKRSHCVSDAKLILYCHCLENKFLK